MRDEKDGNGRENKDELINQIEIIIMLIIDC